MITIITRTSGRPDAFTKNVQSFIDQTAIENICHLVVCDNDKALSYALNICCEAQKKQPLYKYEILRVVKNSNNQAFYNLYFNTAIQFVKNNWILLVDDDDYLINNTCIEILLSNVNSSNMFYIFQFARGSRLKPAANMFKKKFYLKGNIEGINRGTIGGSCILFTKNHAKNCLWDDRFASDFRFILQMAYKHDYKFIPVVVVQATPTGNKGRL